MRQPDTRHTVGIGRTVTKVVGSLAIFGAVALLGVMVIGRSAAENAQIAHSTPPAMTISVATARREDVPRRMAAVGTVMAWQELIIGAPTTALAVVEVKVRENDVVKAGDVLIRFDDRALTAQVAQQKAAVAEAQATLESARLDSGRGDTLWLQKAISLETVQSRRIAVRTSQAKLDQTLASLDQLQTSLDLTIVRAPTDGIVSQEPIRLGAVPQAGTELLRVIRDGRLEIHVRVPERDVEEIKPDQAVAVTGPNGVPSEGRVRDIAAKVDAATRLGTVYVSLAPSSGLRAGMFASVDVTVGQGSAVTIPEQALVWPNGKTSAFVVAEDGSVRLARLSTSGRQDGRIAVESGLQEGDRVAVAGSGFLHDGDTVRVEPALASSSGKVSLQ